MFGERLIALRKETTLSQKECAAAFGVDASKYNKWENEKNNPDYETVCRLAQFFNTTTDYLLGNSNVRHLPDQVQLQDWQRALIAQIMNALQSFFLKHTRDTRTDAPSFTHGSSAHALNSVASCVMRSRTARFRPARMACAGLGP